MDRKKEGRALREVSRRDAGTQTPRVRVKDVSTQTTPRENDAGKRLSE